MKITVIGLGCVIFCDQKTYGASISFCRYCSLIATCLQKNLLIRDLMNFKTDRWCY
jgi:hypothetical protein